MAKKRTHMGPGEGKPAKKIQNGLDKPAEVPNTQSREHWQAHFGEGIFESHYVASKKSGYSKSKPYRHAVINGLVNDELLRGVRHEVLSEIHYTAKETDIYKIHQSGDLANLDGLDDESLRKLPNLLKLRNALYSAPFRDFLEEVTGCGKLSGSKTDMAINIYTPGSHLLCHDDVIGSRRISYILYLTDPNGPWKQDFGGALRLYPTKKHKNANGEAIHVPQADFTKVIYPAWNQLSFFAVQPGQSFHDVGEVYEEADESKERQPMRVAISGWFHIPQTGEDGYIDGEAEGLQKESSLTTLQSSDPQFDFPQPQPLPYPEYDPELPGRTLRRPDIGNGAGFAKDQPKQQDLDERKAMYAAFEKGEEDPEYDVLTEQEAGFLCKYINPTFLAPDQAMEMHESFNDNGHIVIEKFLHPKFARAVQHYISEHFPHTESESSKVIEDKSVWSIAKPPHKHKYLYMEAKPSNQDPAARDVFDAKKLTSNALKQLLTGVFTSLAFRKWLQIITGLVFKSHDARIRRFRRGQDYQLAKLYNEPKGRVEVTLGLTTAGKWEALVPEEDSEDQETQSASIKARASSSSRNGSNGSKHNAPEVVKFEPLSKEEPSDETNNGGYEMFIRGDEEEDDDLPSSKAKDKKSHTHLDVTGKQRKKADPAIYQAAGEDEDDGILLNMAASFNKMSIVLRDQGTMRFVKYVSERAGADRWDLAGEWEVDWERSAKVHGWDQDDGDAGDDEGAQDDFVGIGGDE